MSTNLVVNLVDTVAKIEKSRKQKKTIKSTSSTSIARQYLELQRLRDRLAEEEAWRAAGEIDTAAAIAMLGWSQGVE